MRVLGVLAGGGTPTAAAATLLRGKVEVFAVGGFIGGGLTTLPWAYGGRSKLETTIYTI